MTFFAVLNEDENAAHLRLLKPRAQATPSAPLSQSSSGAGGGEKENSSGQPSAALQQQKAKTKALATEEAADEADDDGANAKESANIPLMRIVMSKKQTKRPTTNRVLREGWMVHYTDRHSMRKKWGRKW